MFYKNYDDVSGFVHHFLETKRKALITVPHLGEDLITYCFIGAVMSTFLKLQHIMKVSFLVNLEEHFKPVTYVL